MNSGSATLGYGVAAAGLDWRAIDGLGAKRLATDSRTIRRGDTFIAYPGETQDGRRYIPQAIANGARAVLWEKRGFKWQSAWRVPNLGVSNLRANAGLIASHVHADPSARLWMVGVTGTNGKTTCSQWIARALDESGMRSAVIGTLGHGMRGRLRPLVNTTPDAVWLHAQLAEYLRRKARAVSMEVSSIGLEQDRHAGVQFDVAMFTNLTRDHLDYHRTMPRYRRAKARLFECESLKHAIINVDDNYGAELAKTVKRRGLKVVEFGFNRISGRRASHVTGSNLAADTRGLRFDIATPWGRAHIASRMLGRFNALNLLGTLAVLLVSGVSLRKAVAAVSHVVPVPGRMQTMGGGTRPLVVVDYAHTPDALYQVLGTLRETFTTPDMQSAARNPRLACVFGCGGERDRGKRPLMGAIAARLADRVILTNDNPRNEDALTIADDVLGGMECDSEIDLNRARAIQRAIRGAQRGDVVLIAGKGHEYYQEIKGIRHPFSDMDIARDALKRWPA